MKKNAAAVFAGLIIWYFLMPQPAGAGFCFRDPAIPDGETITYRSESEGKTSTITEKIVVSGDSERRFYDITSLSPALDTYIRIDRRNMSVVLVHTVQKYPAATLDSLLRVVDEQPNDCDDQIKVPHFVVLTHLLRGFPFGAQPNLRISYYGGTTDKKFNLSLAYKGTDVIDAGGRRIKCHMLSFGLEGFWGTFLPHLKLWYSVEPPHYMVRYKGPEGPPGTPERLIELLEYRVP